MGMDLDPRNKGVEGFHANWWGWSYIGNVLTLAGADTEKMAGSNDGAYVDAKTARNWGKAVESIMPKLKDMLIPDHFTSGGYSSRPIIIESMEQEVELRLKYGNKIQKLDDDTAGFLKEFAKFCVESGGFRQF